MNLSFSPPYARTSITYIVSHENDPWYVCCQFTRSCTIWFISIVLRDVYLFPCHTSHAAKRAEISPVPTSLEQVHVAKSFVFFCTNNLGEDLHKNTPLALDFDQTTSDMDLQVCFHDVFSLCFGSRSKLLYPRQACQ